MDDLGEQIRRSRVKLGLSQGDLGAALGMTQASVSKLETGDATPNASVICALSKALGVDEVSLLRASAARESTTQLFFVELDARTAGVALKLVELSDADFSLVSSLVRRLHGRKGEVNEPVAQEFGWPPTQPATVAAIPPTVGLTLGQRMRQLRERRGLTAAQVAEQLGASRASAYAWEGPRSHPTPEALGRLLDLYGATDAERLEVWRMRALEPDGVLVGETFASLVKRAREERGLTQRELGERVGVSAVQISRFEGGKESGSRELIVRLAAELDIDLNSLRAE